jgi:metal-responsive CopG/Arc/MetJ family transcriptional regulator
MSKVEVTLPEETLAELDRLVDAEFVSREEATADLLSLGLEAYRSDLDAQDAAAALEEEVFEEIESQLWETSGPPGAEDGFVP